MARSKARFVFSVFALFSVVLAGCESADKISGVTERPQYALDESFKLMEPAQSTSSLPVGTYSVSVKPNENTTLAYGKYELFIPKGSVSRRTTFTLNVRSDGTVQLSATEQGGRAVTQFPNGLRLTLPYEQYNVGDPTKLAIAFVVQNGDGTYHIVEAQRGSVDSVNKTLSGWIYHFSIYTIVKEIIIGID